MGDNSNNEISSYNYLKLNESASINDLLGDINSLVNAYINNTDSIPAVTAGINFSDNMILYLNNVIFRFDNVIQDEDV